MTEVFTSTRQSLPARAIRVTAPRIGDILSGALHSAFDNHREMPDEFARLLAQLDAVKRQSN